MYHAGNPCTMDSLSLGTHRQTTLYMMQVSYAAATQPTAKLRRFKPLPFYPSCPFIPSPFHTINSIYRRFWEHYIRSRGGVRPNTHCSRCSLTRCSREVASSDYFYQMTSALSTACVRDFKNIKIFVILCLTVNCYVHIRNAFCS